jgi:sulfite oxidase
MPGAPTDRAAPVAGKTADMIVHQREPFNAETPRHALDGAPLTPTQAFYVRSHGAVPDLIGPDDWSVEVAGLVERELVHSVAELGQWFAVTEELATLQCAGNRRSGLAAVREIPGEAPWGPGATGTARWRGVRLADVLRAAGIRHDARHVAFVGSDHSPEAVPPQLYGASIPLEKALASEVLLATEMNGEPLPVLHGGPVRVLVPGFIGARSVKWVRRLELRAEPWDGYFQATAYRLLAPDEKPAPGRGVELGEISLNADFLAPDHDSRLPAGEVELRGYAIAGGIRTVTRVDVSADAGRTWMQAELLDQPSRWTWRLWRATLRLPPGRHELRARAWDSSAAVQPERPETVWNPKGYVNSAWARLRLELVDA